VIPDDSGYSLIELMIVVGLIGTVAAIATITIGAARPGFQADGAMRVVIAEITAARETALAQRRFVRVDFTGADSLAVTRVEYPSGETPLRSAGLESGIEFGLVDEAGDTPDGFGIDAANPDSLLFNADGMLVDDSGNPINESIFLLRPGMPGTLRAVTVLGSTGRVRGYRWVEGDRWMRI